MKINFLITLALISSILFAGCSATNNSSNDTANNSGQYRKVSLFADVSLTHTPSTSDVLVCLGSGTLSSVMYFDKDGGEYLQQESAFELNGIHCENFGTTKPCTAWTEPTEISIPVTLNAELTPDGVRIIKANNEENFQDQFIFSIAKTSMNPVDITYDCGGAISSLSDYGATFSQLTQAFTTSTWDFGISTENPRMSTLEEYELTGGNTAKIEFGILEEFTDSISPIKNTQKK